MVESPPNYSLPPDLRQPVLESVTRQAEGLSKLLVTTSSAFLGGSLLFLKEVIARLSTLGFWLLGVGWFFLISCVVCVACIGVLNTRSAYYALEGSRDKAYQHDRRARRCTIAAPVCLAIGMALIMAFGLIGLMAMKGDQMGMRDKRTEIVTGIQPKQQEGWEKKSIPYGSLLVPAAAAPATAAPETPAVQTQAPPGPSDTSVPPGPAKEPDK